MKEKTLQIGLTPEQRKQLEKETGRAVAAVQLNLEELERRVAPKLVAN
jgi:hypothetical protein